MVSVVSLLALAGCNLSGVVVYGPRGGTWLSFIVQLGQSPHRFQHAYCTLSLPLLFSALANSLSRTQFILVPYYAWRSSHHAHHKATMSIERDENYVPRTRTDYNLPPESLASLSDYHEIFEETPIYTLGRMLFMQTLGFQLYLATNVMGSPMYPAWTNV